MRELCGPIGGPRYAVVGNCRKLRERPETRLKHRRTIVLVCIGAERWLVVAVTKAWNGGNESASSRHNEPPLVN